MYSRKGKKDEGSEWTFGLNVTTIITEIRGEGKLVRKCRSIKAHSKV